MLGKHKFKIGQRVKYTQHAKDSCLMPRTRRDAQGVVVKVDEFNCPTVLWDYRRSTSGYHPAFIEPVRKKRANFNSRERRLTTGVS